MVLCPHACPAVYAERKACFINAALVGGMLSVDLPLQNRSRLHALVVTEYDARSYKMTVNLSKVGIAALHLNLADNLKRRNMELPYHTTSKLSTHYS